MVVADEGVLPHLLGNCSLCRYPEFPGVDGVLRTPYSVVLLIINLVRNCPGSPGSPGTDMIILGPPAHVTEFICHAQLCFGNRWGTCSSGYWKVTFTFEFLHRKAENGQFHNFVSLSPH